MVNCKLFKLGNHRGRGGGLEVSVLAFYSDDPNLNPADYLKKFLYEKTKINEKETRVGPSLQKARKSFVDECCDQKRG